MRAVGSGEIAHFAAPPAILGDMTTVAGDIDGFWAVIPAGGAGTRLWPLSRRAAPKFLHDLTGSGRTLLQGTWDRLAPLAGNRVVVVTGTAHAEAVAAQLPALGAANLLAEPSPRDSMPAIGLAAAVVARRDPAGGHRVVRGRPRHRARWRAFHDAVREAVAVARTGLLVTIGVTPTEPATGFGYIWEGAALDVPRGAVGSSGARLRGEARCADGTWLRRQR